MDEPQDKNKGGGWRREQTKTKQHTSNMLRTLEHLRNKGYYRADCMALSFSIIQDNIPM